MNQREKILKEIEKWTYPFRNIEDKGRVKEAYDYKKELLEEKLKGYDLAKKEVYEEINKMKKWNEKDKRFYVDAQKLKKRLKDAIKGVKK